mgnify:CR=1 FL=1
MELLTILLHDAFFSAIPAIGFAMVFNVPKRFLVYCALAQAHSYHQSFLVPLENETVAMWQMMIPLDSCRMDKASQPMTEATPSFRQIRS